MATIRTRKQSDGTSRYTAIIRIRERKTIIYQEYKTFASARREALLRLSIDPSRKICATGHRAHLTQGSEPLANLLIRGHTWTTIASVHAAECCVVSVQTQVERRVLPAMQHI
jgi:hypothetical protein